jgi:tRNA(fMet)-specific endonuclease VapC
LTDSGELLLDTDILSALMRRDARALPRARAYLGAHGALSFSIITRYEILRGLKAKSAVTALAYGVPLVTNNLDHFSRVPDLRIESWLR